jgi:hypothetical protein
MTLAALRAWGGHDMCWLLSGPVLLSNIAIFYLSGIDRHLRSLGAFMMLMG